MANNDLILFSQNLKKTALGVKFSKTLFTEPERLNAKTITSVLKTLGLNIPKEIEIANDAAQVIVGGQAIATGLESGKNLADLKSETNLTTAGLRGLMMYAESQNIIDADSASIARIGLDVSMIVASAGTNVLAWVSLAMNVASAISSKQQIADVNAIIDAQNKYKNKVIPQSKILADTFKDFQEKKISIFGVISKMSVETPDLWPQVINPNSELVKVFPDLMMLPVVQTSVTGTGSSEIWGNWPWPMSGSYVLSRWDSSKNFNFMTLGKNFSRESAAEFFFELLLKPWLGVYSYANNEIVARGNMSMKNIAMLTYLVKPDGEISDKYDYVNMLLGANLTPYDFGDTQLDNIASQYVEDNYSSESKIFHEQAVSSGISKQNLSWNSYQKDKDIMRAKLLNVKQDDSIESLVRYEYIYKKLQSYMDFEQTSFERDPTLGGKLNEKFDAKNVRAWRQLHNYFSVLQLLNTFRTDSYLSQTRYAQELLPFMPSIDDFDKDMRRINMLSTGRSVNKLAKANIANLLGTTSDKLQKITTDKKYLGPVKYKIIK